MKCVVGKQLPLLQHNILRRAAVMIFSSYVHQSCYQASQGITDRHREALKAAHTAANLKLSVHSCWRRYMCTNGRHECTHAMQGRCMWVHDGAAVHCTHLAPMADAEGADGCHKGGQRVLGYTVHPQVTQRAPMMGAAGTHGHRIGAAGGALLQVGENAVLRVQGVSNFVGVSPCVNQPAW